MPATVAKYTPMVNVPFAMQLKYIDVWPNDTTKNSGKGYGPSLALRGDIGGADSRVYPKGFCDANIDAMVNAGVIGVDDYDYDPTEKYSIPVKNGDIIITLSQPAGEKYAKTVFALANQITVGTSAQPAPRKNNNVKGPHEFGGPLPGEMEDGYMESLTGGADQSSTGRQTQAAFVSAVPSRANKAQRDYADHLEWVLKEVTPKLSAQDIPVDMAGINAAVATLMIQASKAA